MRQGLEFQGTGGFAAAGAGIFRGGRGGGARAGREGIQGEGDRDGHRGSGYGF